MLTGVRLLYRLNLPQMNCAELFARFCIRLLTYVYQQSM